MEMWPHSISVGAAKWIVDHDIISMHLHNGFVRLTDLCDRSIIIPYIVFYKCELELMPSNHSMLRLNPQVAENLRIWMETY